MSGFLTELRKVADTEPLITPSITRYGTYSEVTATVLGLVTCYVLDSDGNVLGRGEFAAPAGRPTNFYAGGRIKGGQWVGSDLTNERFLSRLAGWSR